MKNIFYLAILLLFITNAKAQQKDSIGQIEKFDLIYTENGTKSVERIHKDWLILTSPLSGGYQKEFAPAKDFYHILKDYHPNGMIKIRGKRIGNVKFGLWEYFDADGNLIELVDEDKKFGEIKPKDLVRILNENGIINTRRGTSIATGQDVYNTNGTFYANVTRKFYIYFYEAKGDTPPYWLLEYYGSRYRYGYYISDIGEVTRSRSRVNVRPIEW